MARGKYAAKAAVRKEARETHETIESYRHAVQRLTKERDESKQKLETTQRTLMREIKVLRAQMESNVAPEVDALQHKLSESKREAVRLKKEYQHILDKVVELSVRTLYAHGWSWNDAVDYIHTSAIGKFGGVLALDRNIKKVSKSSDDYRKLEKLLFDKNIGSGRVRGDRPVDDPEWVSKLLESYEDQA